jgi:class 3 adenylate cyclase
MYRETNLRSRKNIDLNHSEFKPATMSYKEIKKIRHREKFSDFLNSNVYMFLLFVFTIYALFSDDFRILVADYSSDSVFYSLTIVVFVFFALDIGTLLYFRHKYLKSLGFWLDIASALTILLDIGWIYSNFFITQQSKSYALISPSAEASCTYKAAFRYISVMRYVRLLRLNGMLKLVEIFETRHFHQQEKTHFYKRSKKDYMLQNENGFTEQDLNQIFRDKQKFLVYPSFDFDREMKGELTKHSNELSEPMKGETKSSSREFSTQNTRRVIYLILLLIVFIPIFMINSFYDSLTPLNHGLQKTYFQLINSSLSPNMTTVLSSYKNLMRNDDGDFVMASIYRKNNFGGFNAEIELKDPLKTNSTEAAFVTSQRVYNMQLFVFPHDLSLLTVGDIFVVSIIDVSKFIRVEAIFGLARTLFTIIIFLASIYLFHSDSRKLLLGPFEEMMAKIKKIEQNPMRAAKETQDEKRTLEKEMEKNRWKRKEQAEKDRYETTVLINTLMKSGELLALGFGEAGAEIIIEKLNSTRKRENNKVICIFGFCDIRHFSEATDELREDIMIFVNEIAEIISTIVDENTGSTNKNIGEAFLLVWKFREADMINVFDHDANGELRRDIKLKEFVDFNNPITSRCELAVLSFLQCIIVVHTSPTLNRYKSNPLLCRRIPGFHVNMGFGLHIGWAIEGAIGSDHKIDASYLSPNVNLASRLQAATKQFGVHILLSGELQSLLSPEIKKLLRIVDVVNLKGSKLAMRLYTYDMYLPDIPVDNLPELKDKDRETYKAIQKKRLYEYRQRVQKIHAEFFNNRISGKKFFFAETSIMAVRKRFKKSFYDIWDQGFAAYQSGDWAYARANFSKTRSMIKDYTDGPSNVLLKFMEDHDFKAPSDWDGVRHLYSK